MKQIEHTSEAFSILFLLCFLSSFSFFFLFLSRSLFNYPSSRHPDIATNYRISDGTVNYGKDFSFFFQNILFFVYSNCPFHNRNTVYRGKRFEEKMAANANSFPSFSCRSSPGSQWESDNGRGERTV